MSEWKTYKLGDIAELRKEQIVPNGKEQPYIGLEHIEQQSLRLNRVGSSNSVISNKFKFYSGDILYGKLRPYFRKVYKPKFEGVCSTDIYVIKNKKLANKDYLFYLVATEEFTNIANSGSSGTRMPRADWKQLEKSEWQLPDLPTQKQIAQILTSLDDKIELNLQMNQTLEATAQAIFKEWFVNFNFPSSEHDLEDYKIDKILKNNSKSKNPVNQPNPKNPVQDNGLPKGWKHKTIKELGRVITGNTPSSKNPEFFGEVTPFVTPTDFKNFGKLIIGANRYLSDAGRTAMKARLLPKNSIIATCIGSDMGKIAINAIECVTNQQINSIIPNDTSLVDYLYYDLVYKYDYLRNIATGGSTMPIINKSRFEEIEILTPNSDLLNEFQSIMDSFNSKIEENIRQSQSLTKTRDTLLPKLMSGQLSLNTI